MTTGTTAVMTLLSGIGTDSYGRRYARENERSVEHDVYDNF